MSDRISEFPKPAVYRNKKAATWLIAPSILLVVAIGLVLAGLVACGKYYPTYFSYASLIAVVIAAVVVFVIARILWAWGHNPHYCDPDDGNFTTKASMNPLLGLWGSPDDIVELDGIKNIDTPGSKFMSKYFNSSTLVLGDRTFTHVRNVEHLLAIAKYRKSLKSRELARTEELITLQKEANELQRETNSLIQQLIESFIPQRDSTIPPREDTVGIATPAEQTDAQE